LLLNREVLDVGRQQPHDQQRHEHEDERADDEPRQRDTPLPSAHDRSPGATSPQRKEPKRPSSPRLSQMKNALPTMLASGTKPQTRLSLELSQLSPITK